MPDPGTTRQPAGGAGDRRARRAQVSRPGMITSIPAGSKSTSQFDGQRSVQLPGLATGPHTDLVRPGGGVVRGRRLDIEPGGVAIFHGNCGRLQLLSERLSIGW